MDYNTSRPKLLFREYGRNIQKLVDKAILVEDDKLRNSVVKTIIDMMGVINPHLKNVDDYKHKLWDHIFAMSEFKLVAESPYPIPTEESLAKKHDKIPYPKSTLRFKHYGKNVETMIAKASSMEDDAKKQEFARVIANYMKMVYVNWNSEDVTDEHIKSDLKVLSQGALVLGEESSLTHLKRPTRPRGKQKTGGRNQKGRRGGTRNSGGRNSRGRKGGGRSGGRRNYSR